ncbi:MAG: hypothetical protein KME31_16945 [Tolypothrix carrinoi HA7290-LM1]|jgi:hypothetical protein|nr:hypothetical protein [Tolypothrix carrinoi HA7290-LM1]
MGGGGEGGEGGDKGAGGAGGAGKVKITNAQCPMPHAQCPMPHDAAMLQVGRADGRCYNGGKIRNALPPQRTGSPMPHAPCPMPNAHLRSKLRTDQHCADTDVGEDF